MMNVTRHSSDSRTRVSKPSPVSMAVAVPDLAFNFTRHSLTLLHRRAAGRVMVHVSLATACRRRASRPSPLRDNGLVFEFSLCLSRDCLGKVILFSMKGGKEHRFLASNASQGQGFSPRHAIASVSACTRHVSSACGRLTLNR